MEKGSSFHLYKDIAERTDGDVYIGVVGPVRTGKSTFIARFMEELVLPHMAPGPKRDRLLDELDGRDPAVRRPFLYGALKIPGPAGRRRGLYHQTLCRGRADGPGGHGAAAVS